MKRRGQSGGPRLSGIFHAERAVETRNKIFLEKRVLETEEKKKEIKEKTEQSTDPSVSLSLCSWLFRGLLEKSFLFTIFLPNNEIFRNIYIFNF